MWNKATTFAEVDHADAEKILAPGREWQSRAALHFRRELESLALADWDGFNLQGNLRRALALAFPILEPYLSHAELKWVMENVKEKVIASLSTRKANPRQFRETCLELEMHIRSLNCIGGPNYFHEVRNFVFQRAFEAVETETSAHLMAGRSDVAYGIARKFAVDWFETAKMLGAEQVKSIEGLREKCRDRASVPEREGSELETAPMPRELERGPLPRIKR
jgi:hypothetical protein